MSQLTQIKSLLKQFVQRSSDAKAEHDQFIGVNTPTLRKIAKDFSSLTFKEIQKLIESKINEERLLALFILVIRYKKSEANIKNELYQFYLHNLKHVNNWNLVDASAHLIIGAHLINSDKDILFTLAKSEIIWNRRIAIVSTWYFY